MRIVVAGWVNSPHVIAWTAMLCELGYEVALVGHRAPGWPPAEPPDDLYAFEELPLGGLPLVRSLQLGRGLSRAVRRLDPDVVHAHWLPEYGWLAARAGLRPLVTSAWGSDVLGAGSLGRRRSSAAIRGSDLVLADSVALADAARRLVPGGPPIATFHPGVDVERFSPGDRDRARATLGWPTDAPIILSPRALTSLYNPLVVIAAFARTRVEIPGARLVLKHPGHTLPEPVATAMEEAGVRDAVDVIGGVEPSLMPALYRAADVVVSVPSSDSSPATAWEALACGRPLVVSDLPWARAELRHAEHAWLTPIDEAALARALSAVLGDATLADRLGSAGRRLVTTTMDRRKRMHELDEHYRGIVGRSGS